MAGTNDTNPPVTVRDLSWPPATTPDEDEAPRETQMSGPARHSSMQDGGVESSQRTLTNLPRALVADYRIVQELSASGAEADLLVVERMRDHARRVVKIYRRNVVLDEDTVRRVHRAERAHVVATDAIAQSDGRWYEILEYVEQGSLADLIEREGPKLPPDLVKQVVIQIAAAIDHLHGLGVVHRDLKPANVLVRDRDPLDLVLADFGLAAVAEHSVVFLSASRTAAYAAPEALSGSVSAARDYWSLGMIVLETLTGAHPFAGLSQAVIDAQVVTRPVDLARLTDPRWLLLCQGLLTRDPDQRWGGDQVRRWLAGQSPPVALEGAPHPTASQPYRIGTAQARTREDLATALANNWAEARDRIGRRNFLPWFEQYWPDTNLAADARRILEPSGANKTNHLADAEVKLYRLIHLLDPSVAPRFRSFSFDQVGLQRLADWAVKGHRNSVAVLTAITDLGLITALGESTPPLLVEVVDRWQRWCSELRTVAARAVTAGAPSLDPSVLERADLQLFHYAVSPELVGGLRRTALGLRTAATDTQPWFTIIGPPEYADAPRLLLLVTLAAEAQRRGVPAVAAAALERERRQRTKTLSIAVGVVMALALVVGLAGSAIGSYWVNRPHPIDFDASIGATTAGCSSDGAVSVARVSDGLDLTCTMSDEKPGNGDHPYIQVRFDGCDDWERFDHDDGTDPVTIQTQVSPCGPESATLDWQVCQTHGGPLPDDCHDGSTDLPTG